MIRPIHAGSWNPWRRLRELEHEMRRAFREAERPRRGVYPPVNIWTSAEGAVVTAELPGVDPQDLEIEAVKNTLTLRGEIKVAEPAEGQVWHRRERPSGAFARTVELPFPIDPDSVEATCHDGVLEVRLQRPEEQKPRKIAVKVV
ncbi:MAG: Hsp20/alpha crystallin family protein [Planctomycetota bacterium]|jgi:HSP20 family protein